MVATRSAQNHALPSRSSRRCFRSMVRSRSAAAEYVWRSQTARNLAHAVREGDDLGTGVFAHVELEAESKFGANPPGRLRELAVAFQLRTLNRARRCCHGRGGGRGGCHAECGRERCGKRLLGYERLELDDDML